MNVHFPSRNSVVELKVFAQRRAPFSTHSRYRSGFPRREELALASKNTSTGYQAETDRKSLHFLRPDFSDLIRLQSFTFTSVRENIESRFVAVSVQFAER